MMVPTLHIICLSPAETDAVGKFFLQVARDPQTKFFHPHPFTLSEAARVCSHSGNDKYVGLRRDGDFLAYGMLRGWDEGYLVPSLGIYVAPELRGTGAAQALMHLLHLIARLGGAKQVRLKVYRENASAYRMYRAMGYVFAEEKVPGPQLIGTFDL
jgi:ribosomal protein S18 acetylase RimI-like enzyme